MIHNNSNARIENFRKWYTENQSNYEAAGKYVLNRILLYLKEQRINIAYHSTRAKSIDSAYEKAKKQIKKDGQYALKYSDPKNQIMDFSGVRIVVYLPSEVKSVCDAVKRIFSDSIKSEDSEDKAEKLGDNKVGYLSVHYVIVINTSQKEYAYLNGLKCEVQIRTVLQDAWAQIFHDRVYKGNLENDKNPVVERNINLLAGNLELIDKQINQIVNYYDSKNGNLDEKSYQELLNEPISEQSLMKYCGLLLQGKVEKFYSYDQIYELLKAFGINSIRELNYNVNNGFIQELADTNIIITIDRFIRYILIVSDYVKFFKCIDNSYNFVINSTVYDLLDKFIDMSEVCSKYSSIISKSEDK